MGWFDRLVDRGGRSDRVITIALCSLISVCWLYLGWVYLSRADVIRGNVWIVLCLLIGGLVSVLRLMVLERLFSHRFWYVIPTVVEIACACFAFGIGGPAFGLALSIVVVAIPLNALVFDVRTLWINWIVVTILAPIAMVWNAHWPSLSQDLMPAFVAGSLGLFLCVLSFVWRIEQKGNEVASEAAKYKERFVGLVELIRTPIAGIYESASNLKSTKLTRLQRDLLGLITSNSGSVRSLFEDILNSSKGLSDFPEWSVQTFRFDLMLAKIKDQLADSHQRAAKLSFNIAESMPVAMDGPASGIQECLVSLIQANAWFSDGGVVSVSVDIREDGQRHWLLVDVSNSGRGIWFANDELLNEGSVDRMLDSQINDLRFSAGLLRLRTALTLMRSLKGFVVSHSSGSSQSEYRAAFPIVALDIPKEPQSSELSVSGNVVDLRSTPVFHKGKVGSLRIVVIDDVKSTLMLFDRILKKLGHDVALFENGEDGLRYFENNDVDLFIIDMNMAVMHGTDLIRILRMMDAADSGHTVVIGTSVDDSEESRSRMLTSGADSFMAKPVTILRVSEAIENAFISRNEVIEPTSENLVFQHIDRGVYDVLIGAGSTVNDVVNLIWASQGDGTEYMQGIVSASSAGNIGAVRRCLGALMSVASNNGSTLLSKELNAWNSVTDDCFFDDLDSRLERLIEVFNRCQLELHKLALIYQGADGSE